VVLLESILLGVDGGILPFKYLPILTHRADLDADAAGGAVFLPEFLTPMGTVQLRHGWREDFSLSGKGLNRTAGGALEAAGAQIIPGDGVSFQGGGGEYGCETNPRPIFWS
jgi:hypothetical protein